MNVSRTVALRADLAMAVRIGDMGNGAVSRGQLAQQPGAAAPRTTRTLPTVTRAGLHVQRIEGAHRRIADSARGPQCWG